MNERRKRERIQTLVTGIGESLKAEKIILDKSALELILPHRGRMLLLDGVVITDKKVTGEFTVTEDVCKGHEFDGQLIFRGVDIIEMAAQLLGVWIAQHPDKFGGSLVYFKNLGKVKFVGAVLPPDLLKVEISVDERNPRVEITGTSGRLIRRAFGENIVATVKKECRATISSIELVIINPRKLDE